MSKQPQDRGLAPSIKRILSGYASYTYVPRGFETTSDISMDDAVSMLEALMQQRELEARLSERKSVAMFYEGHTFSDATDWKYQYEVFETGNDERIAELERQQTEVMKGEKL